MKKRILIDIILILLIGLTPLLWFKGNMVILGHDSGLPLDPIMHFVDRLYVWSQRFGIGTDQSYALLGAFFIHGFEALLSFIGLSMQLEQKVQFIVWFTLPGLAMYLFVYKLWPEKRYMAISASIIYMINYYLIQAWFIAERTKFSIYIALPLVMYFLLSYLTKRTNFLPSIIFSGLTLGFLNGGGSFPLYGGLLVAILVSYLYINIIYWNLETLKRTILFSFGVGIVYVLLNSYWLVTYYYYVLSFYGRDLANAGGVDGVLTWVAYLSKGSNFINLLKGQGIPEWYLNDYHPYASFVTNNPIFKIIAFGFPFLTILALIKAKLTKDRFFIYLLVFIAIFGIFLSSGTNSPIGFLFEGLVRYVPGFAMFRSAYYKFDYIAWFSYAVLIGFSIDYLLTFVNKKKLKFGFLLSSNFLFALFILVYFVYHYPLFTGLFFDYGKSATGKLSTRITVPDYIFQFGKWSNSQDPNRRFLVLPELNDSGYVSYQWGFWSLAPVSSLLAQNSFVQNTALMPESEKILIKQMYTSLQNQDFDSFLDFTDIFAIDSIVVEDDYDWKNPSWGTTDPATYEKILDSSDKFKLDKQFGKWKVYKIVGREKSNRISISHSLNFLQGGIGDVASFPFYSPKIPLYIGGQTPQDDAFFAKSATGIFLATDCIGCDLKPEDNGFVVYNPKLLPGSFLYNFFVTRGEERVKKQSNDFLSRVNYYLTTADRRSVEIKWMVEFRQNLSQLQPTIERSNEQLSLLKSELQKKDWGIDSAQAEDLSKEIVGHMLTESSLLASVHNDDMLNLQNRLTLASAYDNLLDIIDLVKDKRWTTEDATDKKYLYKLPVTGKYDVYIKRSSLSDPSIDTSASQISIRESGETLKPVSQIRDWIYFGSTNFSSNIIHLAFKDSTAVNLFDINTQTTPSTNTGISKLSDGYALGGNSTNKCVNLPLHNLIIGQDSKYIVSFVYRNFTDNKTLSFSVNADERKIASLRTKETLLPSIPQWTTFQTSFIPSAPDVVLSFCNGFTGVSELQGVAPWLNYGATNHGLIMPYEGAFDQQTAINVSEVKNISVYKMSLPHVILYKEKQNKEETATPVNFVKKNPVEYTVSVAKTNQPTFVTMKESYGKYWQVCDKNKKCLPFDSNLHFADAGFANAWLFKNGINSDLDFYYLPQRTFLWGALVSGISFIFLIVWTIFYFYKKNK